jgi:preprotein translocase subunit SecG
VYTLIMFLHIVVAICLIISILMQSAKGEGLAGAFGGGAFSSAVFGGRGSATFLARATAVLAVVFALTSIGLTVTRSSAGVSSAVQKAAGTIPNPVQQQQQVPVTAQPQAQPGTQPASGTAKEPNVFDANNPATQQKPADVKKTDQKTSQPPK